MRKIGAFLWLISFAAWGQNRSAEYAEKITPENLKSDLTIYASDEFEGRRTGTRGQQLASRFIAQSFEKSGLTPLGDSFFMPVPLYQTQPKEALIKTKVNKVWIEDSDNLVYLGMDDCQLDYDLLVYAGLGQALDLEQVEVKNRVVLVYLPTGPADLFKKARLAEDLYKRGAKMVLFTVAFNNKEWKKLSENTERNNISGGISLQLPKFSKGYFVVREKLACQWFHCSAKKLRGAALASPAEKKLTSWPLKEIICQGGNSMVKIKSENVAGFLEGTDKKEEVIVISAHLDHIGLSPGKGDCINNGADDDGSGIVSMLQMAQAFSMAEKEGNGPRRSILFLAVTGEEEGLLGSSYYTSHPLIPLSQTVVDLNIDMVGRVDEAHKNSEDYVYIIGSDKLSLDLHEINEEANRQYTHLTLDYTYNDINHPEHLYQRSDHWNFAKNNIPVAFYFDGIHEDYHRVTDEVSKINFPLLAKRTKLVFHTAWEIANREETIRRNAVK